MTNHEQQPFDAYLRHVQSHLARLPLAEQQQILAELRAHLDDAAAVSDHSLENHAQQRAVLVAFGPADALGRALARNHGDDAARMRRSAGFGLIAGIALLILTVVVDIVIDRATGSDGPMLGVTFLVLGAVPLTLLPAIVTFRRLDSTATRASSNAYRCGIAGVTGFVFASLDGALRHLLALGWEPGPVLLLMQAIGVGALALIGIWQVLSGRALLAAGVLPPMLSSLTILLGLGWVGYVLAALAGTLIPGVMTISLSVLLLLVPLGHLVWSLWAGCWLLTRDTLRPF